MDRLSGDGCESLSTYAAAVRPAKASGHAGATLRRQGPQ
jgi:hypothetical protein